MGYPHILMVFINSFRIVTVTLPRWIENFTHTMHIDPFRDRKLKYFRDLQHLSGQFQVIHRTKMPASEGSRLWRTLLNITWNQMQPSFITNCSQLQKYKAMSFQSCMILKSYWLGKWMLLVTKLMHKAKETHRCLP